MINILNYLPTKDALTVCQVSKGARQLVWETVDPWRNLEARYDRLGEASRGFRDLLGKANVARTVQKLTVSWCGSQWPDEEFCLPNLVELRLHVEYDCWLLEDLSRFEKLATSLPALEGLFIKVPFELELRVLDIIRQTWPRLRRLGLPGLVNGAYSRDPDHRICMLRAFNRCRALKPGGEKEKIAAVAKFFRSMNFLEEVHLSYGETSISAVAAIVETSGDRLRELHMWGFGAIFFGNTQGMSSLHLVAPAKCLTVLSLYQFDPLDRFHEPALATFANLRHLHIGMGDYNAEYRDLENTFRKASFRLTHLSLQGLRGEPNCRVLSVIASKNPDLECLVFDFGKNLDFEPEEAALISTPCEAVATLRRLRSLVLIDVDHESLHVLSADSNPDLQFFMCLQMGDGPTSDAIAIGDQLPGVWTVVNTCGHGGEHSILCSPCSRKIRNMNDACCIFPAYNHYVSWELDFYPTTGVSLAGKG